MGEYADMEINACLDDVWGDRDRGVRPARAVEQATVESVPRRPEFTMVDPSLHSPLLDCPPCGSDAVEILSITDGPFAGYCHDCCGEGPHKATVAWAVYAWNAMERGREVQRQAYNEMVMLARQRLEERND